MAVPQRMDRRRRPACAHPRRPRFRCARVGAKPDIELQSFRGKPTDAPRSCNVSGIFGIERLQPRGSESAFAGRYPRRYHRHHPRAISMPLARPPLFRLPISRHSEGGIRRRRHLLEHIDATMELAHPAGAESLAPQPSQLAHDSLYTLAPRTRCAPSPRQGEGWGEGAGLPIDHNPSPHLERDRDHDRGVDRNRDGLIYRGRSDVSLTPHHFRRSPRRCLRNRDHRGVWRRGRRGRGDRRIGDRDGLGGGDGIPV